MKMQNNGAHSFTESGYISLLNKFINNDYKFVDYYSEEYNEPSVIWRHDIDFSVHRALSLAKIENKLGISSTYFVLLHSPLYDIREQDIQSKIKQIIDLGHEVGLHFDLEYLNLKTSSYKDLESSLHLQRNTLRDILGITPKIFSYHNPAAAKIELDRRVEICEMINVYCDKFFYGFKYCSDSNCRWNDNIIELINPKINPRLHILTHPVWWTPELISARRDKIIRAANGRKNSIVKQYDELTINI